MLVLDEPTNDLDIETLDLLEELLQTYEGTVFLVSHDRTFLDNVVTSTIAFEGDGLWREYEGGVQDWLVQSRRSREMTATSAPAAKPADIAPAARHRRLPLRTTRRHRPNGSSATRNNASSTSCPVPLRSWRQSRNRYRTCWPMVPSTAATVRAAALHVREGEIEIVLMQALERWAQLSD